jgi:hypothetical protein
MVIVALTALPAGGDDTMNHSMSRRSLLRTAVLCGAGLELVDLAFLRRLPSVAAAEAAVRPDMVRFGAEIEPVVRLLEETPRARLLEQVARRIQSGLSYQEVVAALMLAGVRNVEPRPSVGFKFHAVLVVNSAHLASLASVDSDRWLPIFWALDYFKAAQARDVQENNWTMTPVAESAVPHGRGADRAFVQAMARWDEEAADAAIAGFARSAGTNTVFELLYRFGCRDFRSIGHKAIFVANAKRTLDCIGWQHAEPVLRSLVYALLNHHGEPNPAESDLPADRPWRRNQQLAARIRDDWSGGQRDDGAVTELLATLREGSSDEACDKVVELLNRKVAPQSIYDGLLNASGELLVRQPGIVALHAVTTSNALRYAFTTSGCDKTRRLLLLQNAAFLPMFRAAMQGRGRVGDARIDQLETIPTKRSGPAAIGEIFADVNRNPKQAAGKVLSYLQQGPAQPLIDAARRLVFVKGDDAHDYKFSSAVLEDYYHLSPGWRDRLLATAVFRLHGSAEDDNPLVQRTRSALGA